MPTANPPQQDSKDSEPEKGSATGDAGEAKAKKKKKKKGAKTGGIAAKPRDKKKKKKDGAEREVDVPQTSDVATSKGPKKRKIAHDNDDAIDAEAEPNTITADGAPPKVHWQAKKQKVTHDENTTPTTNDAFEKDTAQARRSRRNAKKSIEGEMSTVPPSKRTKVGEHHVYILERVCTPPLPLPM